MATQLLYSEQFAHHSTSGHPENAQRLTSMLDSLRKTSLYSNLKILSPSPISESLLNEIHSSELIDQIKNLSTADLSWIDFDTYVCKNDFHTASLAAGGLVSLCANVLNDKAVNGFALVRPPGHHATASRSMGFCLFNNVALAAHALTKQGKRVLIFDQDCHHGNGTQQIFFTRKDVLYQSFHLYPHYPGTGDIQEVGIGDGAGYTVNAPVSHGNGDQAITTLLSEIFLPVATQFKPDIILISAGYDSHHADPLGGLSCTTQLYSDIISSFQEIQPRIVCTLEGGYNLNWLSNCFIAQLSQMMQEPITFEDHAQEVLNVASVVSELKNELREYWDF
jgi:acetoin utilization deacetylase AcuC-like enzyme